MAQIPKIARERIANDMYEAAILHEKKGKKSRNYLGMSEIGKPCGRALWYNFRGFDPLEIPGRILMLFRFGDRIEDEVIKYLNLAGYPVEGQQDGFVDLNGLFRGHCDGIVSNVTSRKHILEVKSANTKKFKMFQSKGVKKTYPVYHYQAQCYMGYSGLDRTLFVVQCKDTSEIYTERVYFYKSEFEMLKERARTIIGANEPPAMINNDFECRWCNQVLNCKHQERAIVSNHVCGTCYYLEFVPGLKPFCCHPHHHFGIKRWGVGCPDWINMWEKEPIKIKKLKVEDRKTDERFND